MFVRVKDLNIIKVNKTYKRLIIASEIDGGAEFLAYFLQRHPGVYLITDPMGKDTNRKIGTTIFIDYFT